MGNDKRTTIILASASPRRIDMLRQLPLKLKVIPSGIDENGRDGESPGEQVGRLAEEKALQVARLHPEAWVIGADTIVFIDDMILGKPADPDEARAILTRLSGREHQVHTGYCIANLALRQKQTQVVESRVVFREIAKDEMDWYLATPEPYDKAGAYAVQGSGAFFIREIRGSYTNVMGLPLSELVDSLRSLGIIEF